MDNILNNGQYINFNIINNEISYYSSVITLQDTILLTINENNIIKKSNKFAKDFFNKKINEIIDRRFEDIFEDRDKRNISKFIENVRSKKSNTNFSSLIVVEDTEYNILWHFEEIYDEIDNNILCVGKNINNENKIIKAIEYKNNLFFDLISDITEGIIICDDNYDIIIANNKSLKIFSVDINKIEDKFNFSELIEEKIIEEIKNIKNIYYPLKLNLKSGKIIDVEVKSYIINISNEKYNLFIFRDLFYQKYAQEEVIKIIEKAKDDYKAKNQFISSMSHEIKTPLNSIIGFLDILNETELTEKQKDYVNIITNSSKNLSYLLNKIIEFFKLESGMVSINVSEFNIYDELEILIENFAEKAKEKNINLFLNIDTEIPELLKGDIQKLNIILSELLLNAIKFTNPFGSVVLEVSIKHCDINECNLRFSVIDTGIGIDEKTKEKIFMPFFQENSNETVSYDGCGLGLPVCCGLINLIGGKLNVFSGNDKGSEFYFTSKFFFQSNHIFHRPYFRKKIVAIPYYEKNDFKYFIKNYFIAFGCKCVEYNNINEIDNINDLWIIYLEYNKENINLISKKYKNINTIISLPYNTDYNIDNSFDNMCYIYQPITYKKIENTLSNIYNNKKNTKLNINNKLLSGKILVTDDNEINRKLVKTLLEKYDIEIDEAVNGEEAFKMATKNRYDIIFMDIDMPVLNGIDASLLIHEKERNAGLNESVIIALTAGVLKDNTDSYTSYGMKDYIPKPLEKEKLENILKKYLKNK